MTKYLVDIYIPAAGKHLDAFVPSNKQIGEVIQLLISASETLVGGSYKGGSDTMLLSADSGAPYDHTLTVEEAGIRNASRLILI